MNKEDFYPLIGKYLNGYKIIKIEDDPFIKGQINLWTDEWRTEYFGDKSIVKFFIRPESNSAKVYMELVDKENQELKKQVEELSKNYNLDVPGIYITSRDDNVIRLDKKALEYLRSLEQKIYDLKKQLEECKKDNKKLGRDKIDYLTEFGKMSSAQDRFIKYLEDMLDDRNDIFSVIRVRDILQKYKEITGVENDRN